MSQALYDSVSLTNFDVNMDEHHAVTDDNRVLGEDELEK